MANIPSQPDREFAGKNVSTSDRKRESAKETCLQYKRFMVVYISPTKNARLMPRPLGFFGSRI